MKNASFLLIRWILTAGHCLDDEVPLEVHLGIRPDHSYEETIEVDDLNQYTHPGYLEDFEHDDIGENTATLSFYTFLVIFVILHIITKNLPFHPFPWTLLNKICRFD